jgi:sterol desaturase/sphingolipid hydroxylase (fatty acid hydroxylase superfamily)
MAILGGVVAAFTGFGGFVFIMNVLIGRLIEMFYPLEKQQPPKDVIFDALHAVFFRGISPVLEAMTGPILIYVMGRLGSGWLDLRLLPLPVSLVFYLLLVDFLQYWIHRAYHAFPLLWAFHSFHHSDESFNNFTGWRHVWLTQVLGSIVVHIPLTIVFHLPPSMPLALTAFELAAGILMHLNSPIEFGRFSLWFMNPQFHRIHHSVQPEHWNKNFANSLPLWDVVFRTSWKPQKGEFPDTGLVPSDLPNGFVDALIWPLRQPLRRLAAIAKQQVSYRILWRRPLLDR